MPKLQRGGHASILLTLLCNFAILETQRGGPWPNAPPLNTPLGGTVKRIVKRASLQRSSSDAILSVTAFYEYCCKNIFGIEFCHISKSALEYTRENLKKRFEGGSTIPAGTRSYHIFEPLQAGFIGYKYVASDANYAGQTNFFNYPSFVLVKPMDFVACAYNGCWWIGIVLSRGGVEDTRLEAKAKDTKKIRGQGQGQPFRGQTLSRPRTGISRPRPRTKDTKRKCSHKNFSGDLQKKKKGLRKNFLGDPQNKKKKKVFTKIFQAISTKKRFPKNFSSTPQNFNIPENSAVLEPRTGQF